MFLKVSQSIKKTGFYCALRKAVGADTMQESAKMQKKLSVLEVFLWVFFQQYI